MPMSEYRGWISYLQEDEPDIPEIQLAVLSTLVSNGLGGKSKVSDFIIRKTKPEINKNGLDINQVRSAFGLLSSKVQ